MADDRLGAAGGIRGRGVKEVDTLRCREVHHRDGGGLVDFAAEGHAAEADGARGGECARVHDDERATVAGPLLCRVAAVAGEIGAGDLGGGVAEQEDLKFVLRDADLFSFGGFAR